MNNDQKTEDAVFVPLKAIDATPDTETMLRMLLNHEGLLIKRDQAPAGGTTTRIAAQTPGLFAKAMSQVTQQMGMVPGEDMCRVILPAGATAKDLVPAVGGGFRGMTRAAGSTRVSGHVRLIPATGATIAAGPMIATIALAMAADMLAQQQMQKKLDAISSGVAAVREHLELKDRAVVNTAEQQIQTVLGYLLDQAHIPNISAASHAFGELAILANQSIEKLNQWSHAVDRYSQSTHVNGAELLNELVGQGNDPLSEFEIQSTQIYRTLALRARTVVLEKIAAEQDNEGQSLSHVEAALHQELKMFASAQEQLMSVVDEISVMPVGLTKLPVEISGKKTQEMRTRFFRLARALHSEPEALPILDESDRIVLDLASTQQGFDIMEP